MKLPILLWACVLARLLFYAAALPLWEGYDEWAHFAVIRHVASGELLVSRQAPVPSDVRASLQIAPVPWEMRSLPAPSVTHDAFWTLPANERIRREALFRTGPQSDTPQLEAYEALQPPLYYWLIAPLMWVLSGWPIASQLLAVRCLSVLLASLTIPLIFHLARDLFADDALALACAAVASLMPGFAIDVARAGNDSLAIALFTLLIWIGLRPGSPWLGVVLGLGLLTKAYFLAAVPAVLLFRRNWNWRTLAPVAIAGWWYARNLWTTGTFSGLSESVMLRDTGPAAMLHAAAELPWLRAVDAILMSHLYFGGWSSLTVRSWMYHLFYVVIVVAAVGLVRVKWQPGMTWIVAVYAAFWAAQLYNVLLLYVSKGLPGSMGWYMYAMIGAQVVLCAAGFGRWRHHAMAAGAVLFALFDLYTLHAVGMAYYTGLIRHRPNGTLMAIHWADLQTAGGLAEVLHRLAAFKALPESALLLLWTAYFAATLCAVALAYSCRPRQN